jgi:hypothetical protein
MDVGGYMSHSIEFLREKLARVRRGHIWPKGTHIESVEYGEVQKEGFTQIYVNGALGCVVTRREGNDEDIVWHDSVWVEKWQRGVFVGLGAQVWIEPDVWKRMWTRDNEWYRHATEFYVEEEPAEPVWSGVEVDVNIVFANIKECRQTLKRLENYRRPVVPRNDERKWGEFVDKMGESVRYFDAFKRNAGVDMENLRRAKKSMDEADEKLKAWAGGSAVLYNVERGDLASELLRCKRLIAWLEEHVEGVSEASGASAGVVGQHARMREKASMDEMLRDLKAMEE